MRHFYDIYIEPVFRKRGYGKAGYFLVLESNRNDREWTNKTICESETDKIELTKGKTIKYLCFVAKMFSVQKHIRFISCTLSAV